MLSNFISKILILSACISASLQSLPLDEAISEICLKSKYAPEAIKDAYVESLTEGYIKYYKNSPKITRSWVKQFRVMSDLERTHYNCKFLNNNFKVMLKVIIDNMAKRYTDNGYNFGSNIKFNYLKHAYLMNPDRVTILFYKDPESNNLTLLNLAKDHKAKPNEMIIINLNIGSSLNEGQGGFDCNYIIYDNGLKKVVSVK